MLEKFYPSAFFDLTQNSFTGLFVLNAPVWETLKNLKEYVENQSLGHILIDVPQNVFLINPSLIKIGKGSKIYPGACIEGPCIIGEHSEIGPGAFVRSYTIIGNHCKIGHATEVKHSVLLNHAKAPHFNYVGDSILGFDSNLGAGVVCANFKINKTMVYIKSKESKIPTEMKKLGAIIGDSSSLGCNSVISPGAILKKGFTCLPCSHIKGVHLNESIL
jgi:NDP-sugar pyrophosphorylase family protein